MMAPMVKMAARRMMDFFRPSLSVSAPEGSEPAVCVCWGVGGGWGVW